MIRETSYSQARQRLAMLMDQVTDSREPVLIRRRGKEPVALVAAEELAGWIETAYLLRSPENARRLREASDRAASGAGEPLGVEQLRKRFGLGPVNTYLSASKMSTKWMKPMNITSSFSNRENIRR